jgi:hypothetical protein
MPKIKQLNWDKLKPTSSEKSEHYANKDNIYWRYKKKTSPESTSPKHGEVRVVVFTCSKCKVEHPNRKALDDHWLLEHV